MNNRRVPLFCYKLDLMFYPKNLLENFRQRKARISGRPLDDVKIIFEVTPYFDMKEI